ncbi:MAG: nucleotidyltransferase family protein [Gemmataceae bacterium]|nr:nucleotidyltransferase family protein [Gemmataceae bacterium]
MTLDQLRQRRVDIERIARAYGAHDVRIFGSVARGKARPDSDVDVLVRFEPGRSLLDQAGLQLDLTDLLGCAVDVISEGGVTAGHRILREAVVL